VTWGFGFSVFNTWWSPWPFRPWFWAGWAPFPCFHPWWGPWIAPVVVVGPRFGPHGVVVTRGGAPINRVNVTNIHANNVNVTNIFHRWGGRVATPMGAPQRFNGTRTVNGGAQQGPGGGGAPRFTHGSTLAAAGPGGAPGSNQNFQGFRRQDGQWQRFQGNGQWQNVTAPNANPANRMNQSPPMPQGGAPRPGAVGGAPVVSNVPMRGPSGGAPNQTMTPRSPSGGVPNQTMTPRGPSGPAPVQATPLPGQRTGTGPQGNTWSGPAGQRGVAPSVTGRPAGGQMHSFNPRGARFVPGGGGGEGPPMGRSGGAWVPRQGGGVVTGGNNNMGGGQPMSGGQGRAWGGGGGRMGGMHMR